MNFLSWCKVGYKNETENLYEIPSLNIANSNRNPSNFRRHHYFPLKLQKKEKKENSLINKLNTETFENSYNRQNLFCDKDYVLQIKKINPVKLPIESDIGTNEDDISSTDGKIYHGKKYILSQRINSESKDYHLDIMNLKNMLSESFKQKELFINNDHFKDELLSVNVSKTNTHQKKEKNMNRKKSANIIQAHQNYKYNYYLKKKINVIPYKKIINKTITSSKNFNSKRFKKNNSTSKDKVYNKQISIKKTMTKNYIKSYKNDEKNHTTKFSNKNKKIINFNESKIFNLSNDNSNLKTSYCINNMKNCLSKSIINNTIRDNTTISKIRGNTKKLKISINNSNIKKMKIFLINNKIRKQSSTSNDHMKNNSISKYNHIIKIVKYKRQNLKKFDKKNSPVNMTNHTSKIIKTKYATRIENPFTEENKTTNFNQKMGYNDSINRITVTSKTSKIIKKRKRTKEKKN